MRPVRPPCAGRVVCRSGEAGRPGRGAVRRSGEADQAIMCIVRISHRSS